MDQEQGNQPVGFNADTNSGHHNFSPVSSPAAPVAHGNQSPTLTNSNDMRPVPVVRVLSPLGVEYVFMIISLFGAATGLVYALISLVNGKTDFSVLAFPAALLVVSIPIFAWLFLHLKKLELNNPDLRFDASKRRSTQFTQIVSFITCFSTIIGLVFSIFAKLGGQTDVSIVKILLDALMILIVFGGILYYYWNDEHKAR